MIESNGIVIPAGGERYFTGAYVAAAVIRSLGCNLPIQAWCAGPTEIDNTMKDIIESIPNVTVVDATQIEGSPTCLSGRNLKAFAAVCSPFKKTFVVDIGGVPIQINDKLSPSPVVYHRCCLFSVHYPASKEGHPYEDLCFEALDDLRSRWDGRPWALPVERTDKLGYASHWLYRCGSGLLKLLHLRWDGKLDGGSPMEGYLALVDFRGKDRIVIGPDYQRAKDILEHVQAPLQIFDRSSDGVWRGKWNFRGEYEIELEGLK